MQLGNPSALIPHSGQPVPQQGTDKSLKLSLPFHDSPAGPWGWGRVQEPVYSEWHCQGGTGSPPHWEPCRAPSPPVLHSPTSTSPAQALPVATASWEKSSPNSGDSSAVGGDSTGRQILCQNSPKQSPAPGPWLSEHLLNLWVLTALGTNRENAFSGGDSPTAFENFKCELLPKLPAQTGVSTRGFQPV